MVVKKVEKKVWQDPEILLVGSVAEIVKHGGGKTTISVADPGEPLKVPAQDS